MEHRLRGSNGGGAPAGDAGRTYQIEASEDLVQWDNIGSATADENGGAWDHVAPPKGDRWGPGLRVPTVIASPFAKKGFVDHTVYDTTAILKTIETRFGLEPLGSRDAASPDLSNAFDFGG